MAACRNNLYGLNSGMLKFNNACWLNRHRENSCEIRRLHTLQKRERNLEISADVAVYGIATTVKD